MSPIGRELLDDPDADPRVVRESLHHLARSNAWFGGVRAARIGLDRLLANRPAGRVSLLDVGTGAGDLPRTLGSHLSRRGVTLIPFGLDRHPAAAVLAAAAGIPTVVGDCFALPFANGAVDVVLVSQVAHHFADPAITALAAEASRVAAVGVVLADLTRSRAARLGFRLGSAILGFDPATRADGLTSLDRGFTVPRLAALLEACGARPRITRHPGARIVATWSTCG